MSLPVCGDADTVGHGLDGSEGPAGSAAGLVPDGLDGLALGPLLAGVEAFWDVEVQVLGGGEVLLGLGQDSFRQERPRVPQQTV